MIDIRDRIHQKFADAILPTRLPISTRARYGDGALCSGCDDAIFHGQTEYQFDDDATTRTYSFHVGCYALWAASVRRAVSRQARLRAATIPDPGRAQAS